MSGHPLSDSPIKNTSGDPNGQEHGGYYNNLQLQGITKIRIYMKYHAFGVNNLQRL